MRRRRSEHAARRFDDPQVARPARQARRLRQPPPGHGQARTGAGRSSRVRHRPGQPRLRAGVATAMGITGIRVTDPAELEDAVRTAFATPGPVLLDVLTNPDEVAVPAKPTVEQGWGFAVAKMKEFVRSHGDDGTAD
nr:thiamine pyrophosphate-dependent enzyme [Actinacidiphila oryziradicis]